MIGKIQRVPLREVWLNEARALTPWLQENLDVINNVTNLSLISAEREQAAGSFSVDLVAEDESGRTIIIENQLEKSNHDHLGKLLTYLVAFDAVAAIWITPDPRPEHISVINWLNESSAASFYILKLEAIRIGDSPPAPLFTLIVGPSVEAAQVAETKKELAERHLTRREFWETLLERAHGKKHPHVNISPSIASWIAAGAGRSGFAYNHVIRQHDGRVELEIATRNDDLNRQYFHQLQVAQADIEAAFGGRLIWDLVEGRSACYIRHPVSLGGYRDHERWPEIQDAMIEAMIRLERALRPHINQL